MEFSERYGITGNRFNLESLCIVNLEVVEKDFLLIETVIAMFSHFFCIVTDRYTCFPGYVVH